VRGSAQSATETVAPSWLGRAKTTLSEKRRRLPTCRKFPWDRVAGYYYYYHRVGRRGRERTIFVVRYNNNILISTHCNESLLLLARCSVVLLSLFVFCRDLRPAAHTSTRTIFSQSRRRLDIIYYYFNILPTYIIWSIRLGP